MILSPSDKAISEQVFVASLHVVRKDFRRKDGSGGISYGNRESREISYPR